MSSNWLPRHLLLIESSVNRMENGSTKWVEHEEREREAMKDVVVSWARCYLVDYLEDDGKNNERLQLLGNSGLFSRFSFFSSGCCCCASSLDV